MVKPIIGITCDLDLGISSRSISPGIEYYFLCRNYVNAIQKSGGIPMLIPCFPDENYIDEVIEKISGMVVCGGGDAPAQTYKEEPVMQLGAVNPEKSKFEIMIIKRALNQGLSLLGICGGEQLINVVAGGTLFQDIYSQVPGCISHKQRAPRHFPYHTVNIEEETKLYSILKTKSIKVNSRHHQAVKDLAEGFVASGCTGDGIIESIESVQHNFVIGVQWHPEDMFEKDNFSRSLFLSFIKSCKL